MSTSNTSFNVTPKPSVTKINRLAFYVICLALVAVLSVIVYSVTKPAKVVTDNPEAAPPVVEADTTSEQRWYHQASDALPATQMQRVNATDVSLTSGAVDVESLKKQAESLQAAMDSSIKAPGINSSLSEMSSSAFNHSTSQTIPENFSPISHDSNPQGEKEAFLQRMQQKTDPDYLHEVVKKPISPYEVKAGTIIPAVLAGGLNSDLPGQLTALVSQNIYDSVRGQYLLIPQGSKLIVQYDSQVSYGQERLLVAVKRLIFPNGNSLDLDGMPGVDASGYAGFQDQVNHHYGRIFGSSILLGLITGGFQLSQPQQQNNPMDSSATQIMAGALGQQMGQVTMGMMNKNLDIQPTLIIRPGYPFNVTVTADLVLPGPYHS